jgi:GMP synthase-like glutamine amidotransferase
LTDGGAPTLWIIDPSVSHAEDQGVEAILDGWPGRSRVFRPALRPGDGPTPRSGYETDAIVLMGSATSVYDEPPWMHPLADWLRPVLAGQRELPFLGICFGHQLVAHLAGAPVGFLTTNRDKRVGVEWSTLSGGRLLPGEQRLKVVVSHREVVADVPPGYARTACRDGVRVDGLEHERLPIFTFQFHPEAGNEFAARSGLEAGAVDDDVRNDSRRLLGAFRGLALESR